MAADSIPGGVIVRLDSREFHYAGDPVEVRISVSSAGEEPILLPFELPLVDGLAVQDDGGRRLPPDPNATAAQTKAPEALEPGTSHDVVVDLTRRFVGLDRAGTYHVQWSAAGVAAEPRVIVVLPRYDPTRRYAATVETPHGAIVFDLLSDASPVAVKTFVDLARAGYYAGLHFHEVRADHISAGDPWSVEPPRRTIGYPAEPSAKPLEAGMVVVKPTHPAPPTNGPAFAILLGPQRAWNGQVTLLGQVVAGMDVVQKISKVPTSVQSYRPFWRPLQEVGIRVTISERDAESPPLAGPVDPGP